MFKELGLPDEITFLIEDDAWDEYIEKWQEMSRDAEKRLKLRLISLLDQE